ncbi:hypothetical protein Lesp02_78580 [Lentzea sp. NBRC 105346]|uniref:sigma-70 family RNA polymerase sigma factor n=1 Tax=Lentzea sp. NBRC 105346 TaxID=3032205 RepID=UPI00249FFC22|nr:sigma-70 family RNA polymerase sigma factor [Lentzea sp. NBRC 105346]GLZ35671.1 hypothetical protein Lesp02_78580 [Lentzea sp. NBRC 105346]
MATVPADVQGPSDAELIESVRGGTIDAYGQLYERHVAAAYNLARQLSRSSAEADDLVSEAFAKVLDTLRAGRGPDSAFRAYLLTALRHTAYDKTRRDRKVELSEDVSDVAPPVQFSDTAVAGLERSLAARAFARLPERWQMVLWHTEIEGQSPAEVAPLLGLTANGVSALAYRAREGLRQQYLQMHLTEVTAERCRATVDRLGAWTRGGLSKRETTQVEAHLDECGQCRALAAELADVNGALRAFVAPLVLGAGATGYIALAGTATTVAGVATAGAGAAGAASALPRQLASVGASTAALAAAVAIALASGGPSPSVPPVQAQTPPPVVSTQPPPTPVQPPPAQTPTPPPPSPTPSTPQPNPPAPQPAPQPQPTPATLVPTVPSGFSLTPGQPMDLPITVRNSGQTAAPPPSVTLVLPQGVESTGGGSSFASRRLLAPMTCPAGTGTVTCKDTAELPPGGSTTFVFKLRASDDAQGGTITGTVDAGTAISVKITVPVVVKPIQDDIELTVSTWHQVHWDPRVDVTARNIGPRAGTLKLDVTSTENIVIFTPCRECSRVGKNSVQCLSELQPGDRFRMSFWAFGLPHHGGTITVTATLGNATKTVTVPIKPHPWEPPDLPDPDDQRSSTTVTTPPPTTTTTTTTPGKTTTTTPPLVPAPPVVPPGTPTTVLPPSTPPSQPTTTTPCLPLPPWRPPLIPDLLPWPCSPPPQ